MPNYKVLKVIEGSEAQVGETLDLTEAEAAPYVADGNLELIADEPETPAPTPEDTKPEAPEEETAPPAKSWVGNHKV